MVLVEFPRSAQSLNLGMYAIRVALRLDLFKITVRAAQPALPACRLLGWWELGERSQKCARALRSRNRVRIQPHSCAWSVVQLHKKNAHSATVQQRSVHVVRRNASRFLNRFRHHNMQTNTLSWKDDLFLSSIWIRRSRCYVAICDDRTPNGICVLIICKLNY